MTSLNYEPLRPLRFVSPATQYFEKYKKLVPGGKLYTVKKKARLTCRSNRRLTFSSILSSNITTALAIAVAGAIAVATAMAVAGAIAVATAMAVAIAVPVAVAIAVTIAVAVTARYDTIYYTPYPMYSGIALNCHVLACSAWSIAHTCES